MTMETVILPTTLLQRLVEFQWEYEGFGCLTCRSCGSVAWENDDGKGVHRMGGESCSHNCPFAQATQLLATKELD
jgi:hypothetical protein